MSHIEITRIFGKKTIGLTFFLGAAVMMNAQEKWCSRALCFHRI